MSHVCDSDWEVAEPNIEVRRDQLFEIRTYYCRVCKSSWQSEELLGEVGGIEIRVELK